MGKIANIAIKYYDGNFNLVEIYKNILSSKSVDFFNTNYFLVDFDPVEFDLISFNSTIDVLLNAISTYKEQPLVFSLIIDGIITHHTLNATMSQEINVSISVPKMMKDINVPDFSYYIEKLIPYYKKYEIQRIECSYG
jgi:hypothetical protein